MEPTEDQYGCSFGVVYLHFDPLRIHMETPAEGMTSEQATQLADELLSAAAFFDQRVTKAAAS